MSALLRRPRPGGAPARIQPERRHEGAHHPTGAPIRGRPSLPLSTVQRPRARADGPAPSDLRARLADAMIADAARLRAPHGSRRAAATPPSGRASTPTSSARSRGARRAPPASRRSTYPPELPVSQRADEIAAAIRAHPRGDRLRRDRLGQDHAAAEDLPRARDAAKRGLIGHTQPRRIAARAVADAHRAGARTRRVGEAVGYKVRFTDQTQPDAYVKLMTDGILLAETQGDRELARLRHDHRRRGARAQPQHRLPARLPAAGSSIERPDLRVIDHVGDARRRRASRAHFGTRRRAGAGDRGVGPHCIRSTCATGRSTAATTRPTTRSRSRRRSSTPPRTCGARARATSSCSCPASARSARPAISRGARSRAGRTRSAVEILPLFARLSVDEQQRVFAPSQRPAHGARDQRRRDVAHRARHPLRRSTAASRASSATRCATRRRCCRSRRSRRPPRSSARALRPRAERHRVRLYGEDDFAARPAYTEPEILRSSLAGGDPAHGVARPGRRRRVSVPRAAGAARDRRRLPAAAGARRGRRDARADAARPRARAAAARSAHRPHGAGGARRRLPARDAGHRQRAVGARSARAAARQARRRPTRRTCASATSARTSCRCSRCGSSSTTRSRTKMSHRRAGATHAARISCRTCACANGATCIASSSAVAAARPGWTVARRRCPTSIDAAALRGDPSRAARRPARQHRHARRATDERLSRRARHPLPPASRLGPREEARRNGCSPPSSPRRRGCTRAAPREIEPEWIEEVAGDRVDARLLRAALGREARRSRGERARTLYGLTLVPRRPVSYGRIDPARRARGVHPRGAGAGRARHEGAVPRAQPRADRGVAKLEHKARRQDVLVDDDALAAFYAERVPARRALDARASRRGAREAEARDPRVLHFTREALMRHARDARHRGAVPRASSRMDGTCAAARLSLRARASARRPDAHRAARAAEPARRRALDWLVPG